MGTHSRAAMLLWLGGADLYREPEELILDARSNPYLYGAPQPRRLAQ